jgi:hypothetical protein
MVAVVVAVLEIRPPFSPERACAQCAAELQRYDIPSAVADRYAGDFPVDAFARHAISLAPSDRNKSEIYAEFLPLLNSGCVELLDHDRLKQQLAGLERRTTRGGRDSIDHAPGGHDDVANAVAGAVVEVLQPWARAGGVGQAVTDERQRGGVVKDPTDVRPSWTDFFHRGIRYTPRSSAISRERGLGTAKTYDSEGIDPMGRR